MPHQLTLSAAGRRYYSHTAFSFWYFLNPIPSHPLYTYDTYTYDTVYYTTHTQLSLSPTFSGGALSRGAFRDPIPSHPLILMTLILLTIILLTLILMTHSFFLFLLLFQLTYWNRWEIHYQMGNWRNWKKLCQSINKVGETARKNVRPRMKGM